MDIKKDNNDKKRRILAKHTSGTEMITPKNDSLTLHDSTGLCLSTFVLESVGNNHIQHIYQTDKVKHILNFKCKANQLVQLS